MFSARNQFKAKVKSVKLDAVMAEVIMSAGSFEIVAVITRASADELQLKAGDAVKAVIKATEVMVSKE